MAGASLNNFPNLFNIIYYNSDCCRDQVLINSFLLNFSTILVNLFTETTEGLCFFPQKTLIFRIL